MQSRLKRRDFRPIFLIRIEMYPKALDYKMRCKDKDLRK